MATKLNFKGSVDYCYESLNTFYYYSDHLRSSSVITDPDGKVYEHLEYTPYGEMWVDDQKAEDLDKIPYRFTGKEWDEETNLYYMSARYQNPMTSRWISADPSGPSLVNPMRKGFKLIESLNPYSYVGNNPVMYTDPNGAESVHFIHQSDNWFTIMNSDYSFNRYATFLTNNNSIAGLRRGALTRAQNIAMGASNYQMGGGGWNGNNVSGQTYCNISTYGIIRALGGDTLLYADPMNNTSANDSVSRMEQNVKKGKLMKVSGRVAQGLANLGFLVVAGWDNPSGESGHLATVAQSDGAYNSDIGPMVANVGISNGVKSASRAFGVGLDGGAQSLDDVSYYFDPKQFEHPYTNKNFNETLVTQE